MRQLRDNIEYAFPLLCFVVAPFAGADLDSSLTVAIIGFASAVVLWLLKSSGFRFHTGPRIRPGSRKVPPSPMTFEQGELGVLMSRGVEPVPIPGEAEEHAKSCTFCKRWEETR